MESNKWLSGKIGIDAVLAFVFGVTFVLALLILTVAIPNPTPSQEQTFRIVMSLAAAGIASVIPGMLNISATGGKRFRLQAAGKWITAGFAARTSTSLARVTSSLMASTS